MVLGDVSGCFIVDQDLLHCFSVLGHYISIYVCIVLLWNLSSLFNFITLVRFANLS